MNSGVLGLRALFSKKFTYPSKMSPLRVLVGLIASNVAQSHFTGSKTRIRRVSHFFVSVSPWILGCKGSGPFFKKKFHVSVHNELAKSSSRSSGLERRSKVLVGPVALNDAQ